MATYWAMGMPFLAFLENKKGTYYDFLSVTLILLSFEVVPHPFEAQAVISVYR